MKRMLALTVVVALGALGCDSAFAQVASGAVPLPPSFSESVTSTSFSTGLSSTQSGTGPYDVTNGVATAGTSYTLATEGEASLTIDAGSALLQQAYASVTWNFIVYGPANQSTYVYLQGRGEVKVVKPVGDLSSDDARATIYGNAFDTITPDQSSNGDQKFGISLGNLLNTNTVYTINERISGYSFPHVDETTDLVQASFDPTVGLADTSGVYSIVLSAPVPEPTTWAMMLAGFGLVGFGLRSGRAGRLPMKRLLGFAVVIALGAGSAQAKAAYCEDPTTHKRISCKATPAAAAPAAPVAASVRRKPYVTAPAAASTPTKTVAATTPTAPAYPAPTKKPSMFAGMVKPKPATAPMQSPAPMTRTAPSTASMASGGRKTPNCVKGKLCGMSCIKATDVCHKPG